MSQLCCEKTEEEVNEANKEEVLTVLLILTEYGLSVNKVSLTDSTLTFIPLLILLSSFSLR